jgi:hypothetical protein
MSQHAPRLVPCPACNRHVMSHEGECPFCAAPPAPGSGEPEDARPRGRLGRAALFAAGASATLIGACSSSIIPPYGTSPIDAGSASDSADGAADGGGGSAGGGAHGAGGRGAGGGSGGTGIKPDGGGVVPLYGAPPAIDGG